MKKLKLALVGKDVSQSHSPEVHAFIASRMGNDIQYDKLSVPEEVFESRIEDIISEYDGFNVTIPYKLSVIPHLESVEGDGKIFGSVNTVATRGRRGDNTDGMGFAMMLKNNGVNVKGNNVLVLGAGGAGRSVVKKLIDAGANVSVYDTVFEKAQALKNQFNKVRPLENLEIRPYFMIVNATGVGMHESEGESPVGGDLINLCEVAVDLIYVPEVSKFLQTAQVSGKKTINGEGMLFYQAYFSECIYTDAKPDSAEAERFFKEWQERAK